MIANDSWIILHTISQNWQRSETQKRKNQKTKKKISIKMSDHYLKVSQIIVITLRGYCTFVTWKLTKKIRTQRNCTNGKTSVACFFNVVDSVSRKNAFVCVCNGNDDWIEPYYSMRNICLWCCFLVQMSNTLFKQLLLRLYNFTNTLQRLGDFNTLQTFDSLLYTNLIFQRQRISNYVACIRL